MHKTISAATMLAVLLGGCTLAPDYQRPAAPVPASWSAPPVEGDASENRPSASADLAVFLSPTLKELVALALENNRDLRVAALNVDLARATYRVRTADRLPSMVGGADGMRQHVNGMTTEAYSADLGLAAYEVDLFGRLRSLEAQAVEEVLATDEARAALRLSLIAEVADAYLTLLADQRLLALTEETLEAQEKAHRIVQNSHERGIGTRLAVVQSQSALEAVRASRARYIRQVAQDRNALALLVGAPLDTVVPTDATASGDAFLADIPGGLTSDILLRRPDILEAEHRLKAANANIGATRAALYPSIRLTGSLGTASPSLAALFGAGTGVWTFMPSISLPIFDGGRGRSQLQAAEVSAEIAVARYEKAIQAAFREVADGLAAYATLNGQIDAQTSVVEANRESHRLALARFESGVDSYLGVLDAQRSLFGAEQELVSLELAKSSNLVSLYRALGGGWNGKTGV